MHGGRPRRLSGAKSRSAAGYVHHGRSPARHAAAAGRRGRPPGVRGDRLVEPVVLEVQVAGLPAVRRPHFALHPELPTAWREIRSAGVDVAGVARRDAGPTAARRKAGDGDRPAGSPGRPTAGAEPVAAAPPTSCALPAMVFRSGLRLAGGDVSFEIVSPRPCEGPVVRPLGALAAGTLAGVEYLGPGKHSSSTLDIETDEHLRFAPDPLKVTMPLMVGGDRSRHGGYGVGRHDAATRLRDAQFLRSDRRTPHGACAERRSGRRSAWRRFRWRKRSCGPSGKARSAAACRRRRTEPQQFAAVPGGLHGPLKSAEGWGHCVEAHWPRQPYAAIASTFWRLTGRVARLPKLVPGGRTCPTTPFTLSAAGPAWLDAERRQVGRCAPAAARRLVPLQRAVCAGAISRTRPAASARRRRRCCWTMPG